MGVNKVKKCKKTKRIIVTISFVLLIVYGIYWAFFDIQRIDGQEFLSESTSPDGRYTVTAYLNNGGATTDYAVLCTATDNETGRERNIYWNYKCEKAEIEWVDEDTAIIVINGVELDVMKDKYDWRTQ
ncbi:MAG: DUF5412 domain-containing protein [Clostridia bacterium]|nr:DUF5412 domain-containing protein [Clostridia bacterium]